MPDRHFADPRLAAVYDALDPDRGDLDAYVALARELGARSVVDVGCGTGCLALLLAARGLDVVGIDPALASLDVARTKPLGERVRWVHGVAADLPELRVDLVVMTGNVAQAIVDPGDWESTLAAAARVLAPGGHLVFETRDPAHAAWRGWDGSTSHADVAGIGAVTSAVEVTGTDLPLVGFRTTFTFDADGAVLTSDSVLRFRSRTEIEKSLQDRGFLVDDVRDAPDRPGLEWVFVARRVWGQVVRAVVKRGGTRPVPFAISATPAVRTCRRSVARMRRGCDLVSPRCVRIGPCAASLPCSEPCSSSPGAGVAVDTSRTGPACSSCPDASFS